MQLLAKHAIPENIVMHSLAVEKAAVFIAEKLLQAGEKIDVSLVSRAALLHDIDKPLTLASGSGHGLVSKQILEKEGLPEIALIALKHHTYTILQKKPFSNWEEKVVYYSDKRVNHDQIVSLRERFDYLLERYGKEKKEFEKIFSCKSRVEKLEKEIFSKINASSELEELK